MAADPSLAKFQEAIKERVQNSPPHPNCPFTDTIIELSNVLTRFDQRMIGMSEDVGSLNSWRKSMDTRMWTFTALSFGALISLAVNLLLLLIR